MGVPNQGSFHGLSLLHPREKNTIVEGQANYEVASIYAEINDDCIELIQDCFHMATIMSKFRLQFADKGWGAESTAYPNL